MNKRPLSSLISILHWGALQIAGIYLLLGSAWILFSDRMAASLAPDPEVLATISLYKGWAFVLLTALLFYWLVRRHTARLQTSELRLQGVIDALPALIAYIDKDRRYQFTNEAYDEWFGMEAQGKHMAEILGPLGYQKIVKYVDKVLNGETTSHETVISYREGGERYVHAMYVPDFAPNGGVKGFFALVHDTTDRKQAQEELRQWADAFEGCAHGIAIGDPHTNRILVCNPAFANMHKCSVEDIIGTSFLSLYAAIDHEHVRRHIQRADQIGLARFEARMIRKDSSIFPVQTDVVSVLGEGGELLRRVVTAQDISDRRQAEQILKESEERYRIVSELTSDYAYKDRVGADGSIVPEWFTDSFTRITGYSIEETQTPEFWKNLIHPEDMSILLEHIHKVLSGESDTREMRVLTKDGQTRWLKDYSNPVWDTDQERVTGLYGAVQDITEQRQAEEKIRIQAHLLEQINDAVITVDENFVMTAWNPAAERLYGWKAEEVVGKKGEEILKSGFFGKTRSEVIQNLRESGEFSAEITQSRKDGARIQIETRTVTLRDQHSQTIGYVSVNRDITERKQAEEALRSSQAQVSGIVNHAMDAIISTDADQRILMFNPAAEAMFQCTQSEAIGQLLDRFIPERFREAHRRQVHNYGRTGVTNRAMRGSADIFGRRSNGDEFPCEASISQIDIAGKKIYTVILRDITKRKQIEQELIAAQNELEHKVQERTAALTEANALLQALLENMPDHIYFKDTQSRFIRNSRSQAEMLGLSDPAEATGKTDFDFFPHAAKSYAEEQEVMRSGKPLIDFEEWVVWPDGKETWVSTTKMPLRDAQGQTIGIFGISRDITDRKRAEQAILQLNVDLEKKAEQLQVANKELEAFSYSVSHDLRAPLRAIDGYTRILMEDYESILDSEGKRVCGVISREARRMGQLIDDLLTFSRLGRKELSSSKIDMGALAASVFTELVKDEDPQRIDLQIAKLPSIRGDTSLIRQVWTNLLANAFKFTSGKERAAIEIGAKTSKEELIYYVRDNGAGFEMAYVNKLFGVFQRLHSENEFSGTGVGLAIVQRIIHRHGGRVWAEGEVEKGATFYFALPRKETLS